MNLRLFSHRTFHQRILRQIVLPRVVDIAFRKRVHLRPAAFQVTLIIFIQAVTLCRDARGISDGFCKLRFQAIDIMGCGDQIGLESVDPRLVAARIKF